MKVKFLTSERIPLGGGYYMRYNHSADGPNFSRVDANQVMLLSNHKSDLDKVLGNVSNAYSDGKASYAEMSLFDMPDDPAIAKAGKMLENGAQGLSAGILVHSAHVEGKTLEVDNWELIELSMTPVPRDPGTSVGMAMILNEGGSDNLISRYFGQPTVVNNSSPTPEPVMSQTLVSEPGLSRDDLEAFLEKNSNMIANAISEAIRSIKNDDDDDAASAVLDAYDAGVDVGRRSRDDVERIPAPEVEDLDQSGVDHDETEDPEIGGCDICAGENTDCSHCGKVAMSTTEDRQAISRMAGIAKEQARYNKEQVLQLQMDAELENWTKKQFVEKLESIAIHPSPFAPNSSVEKEYNVGLALTEMMRGRVKDSSFEHSLSDEILNKTLMPVHGGNTLAIPRKYLVEMNTKYGGTAGTDSAEHGVIEELLPIIRTDVPDPLDVVPLCTRIPSSPGETKIVYIEVPTPGMVAEPGDSGYAKTGDAYTKEIKMTPKLQVDRVLITRLASVTVPTLMASILNITLAKMTEVMNTQLLIGTGSSNQVTGIYNWDDINSTSEMAALSGITSAVITDALNKCYQFPPEAKRIIIGPEVRSSLQTIARPTAVDSLVRDAGWSIDGTPILTTRKMERTKDTPDYRGIVGPFADVYVKQWDDAVFVHNRYEDGNHYMVVESFWDMAVAHPELWTRILDNA